MDWLLCDKGRLNLFWQLLWILFDFQSYYNGIVNGFVLIGLLVTYARFEWFWVIDHYDAVQVIIAITLGKQIYQFVDWLTICMYAFS